MMARSKCSNQRPDTLMQDRSPLVRRNLLATRGRTIHQGQSLQVVCREQTHQAVDNYLKATGKRPGEFLFTGRRGPDRYMTTRPYARLVSEWIGSVGLGPRLFGTHPLRRTKADIAHLRVHALVRR